MLAQPMVCGMEQDATRSDTQSLTVTEVAARLGVGRMTAYRLIANGELAAINVGTGGTRPRLRVTEAALRDFINSRRIA